MKAFQEILSDVLSKIFEAVFSPILEVFLKDVLEALLGMLKNAVFMLVYWLYTSLLGVIDFLLKIFEFFSGSEDVVYVASDKKYTLTVLELFFKVDGVQTAFLIITCLSVGLAFVFTVFAAAKSISDMTLENKNPIGRVLGSALKCCFIFMLVPFFCVFMLRLSAIVLDGIDTALQSQIGAAGQASGEVSISTIIWLCSSMDAANDQGYNISTSPDRAGFEDAVRKPFFEGRSSWKYGSSAVKDHFQYSKFKYGMGFFACIFLILILMASILLFIRRIFEIVVLYVVSPFFVSTMPLDEGHLFRQWKDMFIAKFFSAFGCVFAIRLYVMFIPILACGGIDLFPTNADISYFLQTLFMVGGAYAVFKSQHMILTILHPEAGSAAEQTAGTMLAMVGTAARTAKRTAVGVTGMVAKGSGQTR